MSANNININNASNTMDKSNTESIEDNDDGFRNGDNLSLSNTNTSGRYAIRDDVRADREEQYSQQSNGCSLLD